MDKRIAPGVWRTATGFRAYVRVPIGDGKSKLIPKRFGPRATLTEMKQWRQDTLVAKRKERGPKPDPDTLAQDIDRYLAQVAAMPTYEWRKRDLHAWREVFGDTPRANITTGMIRAQLHTWRMHGPVLRFIPRTKTYRKLPRGLSASACNHRRTALLHLWTLLDGRGAPNPVREIRPFREPPPEPRGRDMAFLEAAIARMRNDKDRARCGVLLWTGIRGNSELGKMKSEHVQLHGDVGECHVPTGKGGRRFRYVPLNKKGVAAWEAFAAANAWGTYNKDLLRRAFQRACRAEAKARDLPLDRLRPYDLRHSVATAYLRAGADLADVQELLGHSTPRMTRRYAPLQREKLTRAAFVLEQA